MRSIEKEDDLTSFQTAAIFGGIGLLITLWAVRLDQYAAVEWF